MVQISLPWQKKEDESRERVESEQQQQIPFYADPSTAELGKIMIDSTDFVNRTRYRLLGYIETDSGIFEPVGHKLMNPQGASWIITMLDSHIGKDVVLTKIDEDDVIRITKHIWRITNRAILSNKERWGMPNDPASWSLAVAIVVDNVYFALKRGENGEEKRFFAKTHESKIVSRQDVTQKQPRGFSL